MKILGWFGAILMLGTVGACEMGDISLTLALIKIAIGLCCVLISLAFYNGQQYYLEFIYKGKVRRVRTNTYIGRLIVIYRYKKLGYTLANEWEVA